MNSTTVDSKKAKRDIRIVFIVFSVLFSLIALKNYPSLASYILFSLAGLFVITLTFTPLTLQPAFRIWLKIAHFIGSVNTQILLTLLYYLVFTPFALVMRMFGRDAMQRKQQAAGTYWQSYEIAGLKDKTRYEKQF